MAEGTDILRFGKGTTHTTIYFSEIKALHICLPPINEQHRIVRKTEGCLDHRAKVRSFLGAIPPLLDRYRQSILASAFRGELTVAWRSRHTSVESVDHLIAKIPKPTQPKGGRRATTRTLPGHFALSVNMPSIRPPAGWIWMPLSRIARQETGHTPSRKHPEYWGGNISWLSIPDARDHHGKTIFETSQHVTPSGLQNSASRILPAGTVCLSRTASVGYTVIMGKDMATSQAFVAWTCTKAILPKFLMYLFITEVSSLRRFARGTTHTTIYFPELRAFHVCLPPLEEQYAIVQLCDRYLSAIERMTLGVLRKSGLLEELSQSVFSKALQGELIAHNPKDEPVETMLEHAIVEQAKREAKKQESTRRSNVAMVHRDRNNGIESVVAVLTRNKSALSTQRLLVKAGYPSDVSPEALELFFLDLREQLNSGTITRHRDGNEDIFALQG